MKKRKRVLIDSFHLFQALTGIRTYTKQLCLGLDQLNSEEIEYLIYPNWKKVDKTSLLRGKVNPLLKVVNHFLFFIWKQICLPLLILFKRVDVVVTTDYLLPYLKFGAKSVTVFHDTFYWEMKGNYNPVWLRYFLGSVRMGLNKDTTIIVTTHYIAEKVRNIVPNNHKLSVVYQSPAELIPLSNKTDEPLEGLLPEGANYFLHVGVFDERKNLPVLIKAFYQILKHNFYKDFYLVLAGSRAVSVFHDDFANIKTLISELGLEKKVIIPGFVPNEDLVQLYKNAFAYVFPSKEEGFGIPVIEAMKSKVPVVISNQAALMEVAGEAALVFEMDDEDSLYTKMLKLTNQALRNELIEKGNRRAEMFGKEEFAIQFHKVVVQATNG